MNVKVSHWHGHFGFGFTEDKIPVYLSAAQVCEPLKLPLREGQIVFVDHLEQNQKGLAAKAIAITQPGR
ncbi:MAG TPA: hypothetical protein VMI32_07060 [Candidatus Solibacter sp.]|nr:hypothetical protein [Candidatus Solibacter sp.]